MCQIPLIISQAAYTLSTSIETIRPLQTLVDKVTRLADEFCTKCQKELHQFVVRRALSLRPQHSPSTFSDLHKKACERLQKLSTSKEKEGKIVTIEREAGVTLNGVEIQIKPSLATTEQKWIVFFLPNGMLWEEQLYRLKFLSSLFHPEENVNIICCNYRGRGKSCGFANSETEVIFDGKAIVDHLLEQRKVPKENILLHGWSLGGGIATQVAALFAKRDMELSLVNERSFSSLFSVLDARISVIGALFGHIAAHFGWNLNSAEAVRYLKKKILVFSHPQDVLILPRAQFIHCAKEKADEIVMTEDENAPLLNRIINRIFSHGREWYKEETKRYVAFVRAAFKSATLKESEH